MSISEFLTEHKIRFETLSYPPAYTAQRRAAHLRLSGRSVAKTVLMCGPAGYFVVVLPATRRVNTEALAAVVGGPVHLAKAEEVARVFPDCEYGVAAPFGSRYGVPTYLDAELTDHADLVLPADSHHEAVRLRCADFEQAERPHRLPLASR